MMMVNAAAAAAALNNQKSSNESLNFDCWNLMNHVLRTFEHDENKENQGKILSLKFLKSKVSCSKDTNHSAS